MTAQTEKQADRRSAISWLRSLETAVAELLFPPRCVGCSSWGAWLCSNCLDRIESIKRPLCDSCGLPLPGPAHGTALCSRCVEAQPAVLRLRSCAFHTDPLRQAIHQLKYEGLKALAPPLGQLMAKAWPALAPADGEVDAIVPIPLHRLREKERGYNQAALLAREFGLERGLPVLEGSLIRTRNTSPQIGLTIQKRRENVRGAFECTDSRLKDRAVLMVDDVCTTGATLAAAAAAVWKAGARSVCAYTLARAKPRAAVEDSDQET